MNRHIAYFISPHGFGHAARAAAVMAAVQRAGPTVHFDLFTTVPEWFFNESLPGLFTYHYARSDVGLIQRDALNEDIEATVDELDALLPFNSHFVAGFDEQVRAADCRLIVCDIAPLGISVAQETAIPSLLVENFTWDWIYEGYLDLEPRLKPHIGYLWHLFSNADYHIQTEPVCKPDMTDLVTGPIARQPAASRDDVREKLGIGAKEQMVLVTMSGSSQEQEQLDALRKRSEIRFVVPGVSRQFEQQDNLVLLPHRSGFYHPDLIHAADAVVSKLGYSTLAEVYEAGAPLGYVARPRFRESPVLEAFVKEKMSGVEIGEADYQTGRWVNQVQDLLALPRRAPGEPDGANEIARFILDVIGG